MIQLDQKFKLQNNSTHGVELVFEEKRTREKLNKQREKTGETEIFLFKDTWYYPNPVLAIKKWIELTSSSVDNLDELIESTTQINKTLDKIYSEYVKNGRKL